MERNARAGHAGDGGDGCPDVQYNIGLFGRILEGFGSDRYSDIGFLVELGRGTAVRLLTDPFLSAGRDSTSYLQPAVQALDWEELMGEAEAGRVVGRWLVSPYVDGCVAGSLATV